MATVNLNLSFDSNQINISLFSEEMIEFNKKWSKIVELFKGELFVEDGDCDWGRVYGGGGGDCDGA